MSRCKFIFATKDVFSNCAIAPSTCLTSTAVGVSSVKKSGACRNEADAKRFQEIVPGELYCQVAGESIRAFHDDAPDTIAGNPVEHSFEAAPLGDWIATAHSRVIELVNNGVAVRLGKSPDGRALTLVSVEPLRISTAQR